MEKGILHIRKKPRHIEFGGKPIPIKKEVPEIGKEFDKLECEFEGNPAVKIVVAGTTFSADMTALAAKQERAKEQEEHKKAHEEMLKKQEKSGDSFLLSAARIPKDTREAVLLDAGDNFLLKLNRFARYDYKDNKEDEKHFKFFNAKAIESGKGDEKRVVVPAIRIKEDFGNLFSDNEYQLADRQIQAAEALFPNLIKPVFKPEWRFVTGLGGHSVYETGITLHHVYGIPFIPASSIKGVLRSWLIYSKFGNNEGKAISECEDFCKVFGCPAEVTVEQDGRKTKYKSIFNEARQGKVAFFDALPLKSPTIEPDIMNPHYPQWYGGKKGEAPVDTDNLNPVFFLTVKDTPFQFLLGSKEWNLELETLWDGKTLGWWLENALAEHGIGAKTAVGYGYFKPTSV
jgi:CRISPR-associated protein Cmr6